MSSKNTSRETVNERRSSIKIRESNSGKGGFFSSFGNISAKVQKKVRKVGQKVGQQVGLNLVTLSNKNIADESKDNENELNFDFPTIESFIGENPLSRNNRETDYMRDTEYLFSEIDDENVEEYEEYEEEEENDDDDDDDDEDEEENNDDEDLPEDTNLFDPDDEQEFLNLLRSLLRDEEIGDSGIVQDSETKKEIVKIVEGTIVTGHHHKHKLKVATDLRRMRRNICNVCRETGGIIAYCDAEWDCDFDMCYECYIKESDMCDTHKLELKEGVQIVNDKCPSCNAIKRKSEGAKMNPSIFDNKPTKSTLSFKEHHTDRINVMCLYIPPVSSRKTLATIITASDDGTVCIWNLFSGALIRKLENEHDGAITAMELYQNPLDEKEISIVTGGEDKTVKIWSYNKGKVIRKLRKENTGRITGVAIARQTVKAASEKSDTIVNVFVVSVDQGSTGCIFDYHTGKHLRVFANQAPMLKVLVCHWKSDNVDQCAIVTADEANMLVAWKLSGDKMFEFDTKSGSGTHVRGEKITSMIALENGNVFEDLRIVTGAEDSQILIWSLKERIAVNRFMVGHKEGAVSGLAFYKSKYNKNDIKLLSVGEDGGLLVWDYYRAFRGVAGQNLFKYPISKPKEKYDPLTCVSVYVNPNNRNEVYVITSTDSGRVTIWDLPEDEALKALQAEDERKAPVANGDTSPSHYFIPLAVMESIGLAQQDDEALDTADYLDFDVQDIVSGHKKAVRRVVYCKLDDTIITGSSDRTAIQWSMSDGRVKLKLDGDHKASIAGIAVIPTPTSADQCSYEVLTVDFKGICTTWKCGVGSSIEEFNICDGKIHEERKMINGLSFYKCQDRDCILTVSGDATCCVWDYRSREVVSKLLNGHSAAVLSVSVLQLNLTNYIFTCSRDSTIVMWSFKPEEPVESRAQALCTFKGHKDEVNQVVAFKYVEGNQCNAAILSCSDDRTCALWKVPLDPASTKVVEPLKRYGKPGYGQSTDQHSRLVVSLALFGDQAQAKTLEETYFISVGFDEKTVAWNCASGFCFELKSEKGMHTDCIYRVVVASTKVITVSDDCTGIVWDVSDIKSKTYSYTRRLGSSSSKGLTLTHVGLSATKEIDIIYTKDAGRSSSRREDNEEAVKEVRKLANLEIWRQGQFIVGFCFISIEEEEKGFFAQAASPSKTFGHIYYIDTVTNKINYYYRLEIDDCTEDKPTWLKSQFYSLKFKALSYYCRFNDAKGVQRALKKFFKDLLKYQSSISDVGFKELTAVPLIDPLGLVELAYKFPIIFRDNVCKLRLIDCTSVMFSTEVFKAVYPDIVHIESRPEFDVNGYYCWSEEDIKRISEKYRIILEENSDTATELMSLFVPLPHAGSFEMLEAYVHCCKVLNDVSLFDNEVVLTGLNYAWQTFGIYAHLRHFFIFALFITALMLSTFTFSSWSTSLPRVTLGIQVLVLVLVGYLVVEEVLDLMYESIHTREEMKELKDSSKHPRIERVVLKLKLAATSIVEHFINPWNAFDLLFHVVTIVGTSYRILYWRDSQISTSCLAVAILFAWIKAVYFLQAFRQTGPLVAMIAHITKEIMPFLGVLFMILIGFTSAFFLLSQNDDSLPFGTIQGGFLSAFDYMLGSFSSDFSGTTNPQLATVLFILYMLFALVVMFNLLIAIMSNAYTEVQVQLYSKILLMDI